MAVNLKTAFGEENTPDSRWSLPPNVLIGGGNDNPSTNPFGLKVPDIKDIGDMDRYDRSLLVGKGLFDVAKLIVGLHYAGGAVDAVSGWLDKNLDFTLLEMPAVSFISTIQLYHAGDELLMSAIRGDLFRSAKLFLSQPISLIRIPKPLAIARGAFHGAVDFGKGLIGMGGGYLASNAFDATLGDAVEKRFGKNWRRYAGTLAFFSGDIANALTLGGAARLASRTALRRITPIFGTAFLMEILVPSAQYAIYGAETSYLALLSYDAYEKRELPAWQRFFFNATFGESFMANCVTSGFGPVAWMVDGVEWMQVQTGGRDVENTSKYLRSAAQEENDQMVKELLPIIKDALFKAAAFGTISHDLEGLEELIKKGWLDKVELSDFAYAGSLPFKPNELVNIVSSLRNLSLIYDDDGEAAKALKKFVSWELRKGELEGGKVTAENIKDLPAFDVKGGGFIKWLGGEEKILQLRRRKIIKELIMTDILFEIGEGDERGLRLLSLGEKAGLIERETKVEGRELVAEGRPQFKNMAEYYTTLLNISRNAYYVTKTSGPSRLAMQLTKLTEEEIGTGVSEKVDEISNDMKKLEKFAGLEFDRFHNSGETKHLVAALCAAPWIFADKEKVEIWKNRADMIRLYEPEFVKIAVEHLKRLDRKLMELISTEAAEEMIFGKEEGLYERLLAKYRPSKEEIDLFLPFVDDTNDLTCLSSILSNSTATPDDLFACVHTNALAIKARLMDEDKPSEIRELALREAIDVVQDMMANMWVNIIRDSVLRVEPIDVKKKFLNVIKTAQLRQILRKLAVKWHRVKKDYYGVNAGPFDSGILASDGSVKDIDKLFEWVRPTMVKALDEQRGENKELVQVLKNAYTTLDELLSKGYDITLSRLALKQKTLLALIADTKRQITDDLISCHSRESGNPDRTLEITAFAGMTPFSKTHLTAGEFLADLEKDVAESGRSRRLEKYLASLEDELHDLNTLFVVIYLLGSDLQDENIAFNEEILDKIGDRIRDMEDLWQHQGL